MSIEAFSSLGETLIEASSAKVKEAQGILNSKWSAGMGSPDGKLGPMTYNHLSRVVSPGWATSSAADVIARLNTLSAPYVRYFPTPSAVKLVQTKLGISATGKFDRNTEAKLAAKLPNWKTMSWTVEPSIVTALQAKSSASTAAVPASSTPAATTESAALPEVPSTYEGGSFIDKIGGWKVVLGAAGGLLILLGLRRR